MIINFYNLGGGGSGSGGTSNYNELSNKPQINGVTLSGNVSSDQLGITPNELKAVENVPSAATNGSVFSEYREDEVKYGWQYDSATGTAFTFDISLNPYSGVTEFTICYFNYNGSSYQATLQYYEGEDKKTFVFPGYFYVVKGEIKENQGFWDSDLHVTVDYSDITKIVLTFDNDVEISDEIAPASSIQVTKELKQAYNQTESVTTEWAFWGGQTWQGKAENTEFRMPTNFIMPSGETLVSNLTYYDIPINTYWDGTQFKVEYSLDSGTTWQWAFSATTFGGSDGPVTVGPSEGQGKTCELSYSWYYYGDVDKNCFKLSSNKSLSHPVVNNFTNEYNVVYFDTFLKSGSSYNLLTEKPQINGVELVGNKTSADLGISGGTSDYSELDNKPSINGIELDGNVTSDDLNLSVDKVKELEAVTVLPTVARDGSVFAYSQPETVFGWENIGYDADNKFKAEFVFKQMPSVSDMPITLGTANVTGSLDETISQDLVLINDFFDGIIIQVGTENYMRKGQLNSFWYHGDNNLTCEYDWTNEALLKFTIYESSTSQTKSGATITNQVDSAYVSINSLVQADGVDASGNTIYTKVGADGMHLHWYAYSDGCFTYAREKCSNDGDYLVHQGTEIEGSRTYAGVRISGGTIIEAPYSGVNNIGDGHWAGSKEDANGVSYFFHCWIEDGYLYWQTSSPIMDLDAYGTGTDLQGGLMYGGETNTGSSISQIRFTNLDLAAMSIGDTTQVVVAMPDMEFGKQYLKTDSGATSGVSFGGSVSSDFADVITTPSYVFTLEKVSGTSVFSDVFTLTPSDTVNFNKLSWYCTDVNAFYPLSFVSNYSNYTLTFVRGKVKLVGAYTDEVGTHISARFPEYFESQNQLKRNQFRDGEIEFILYKIPTV